MKASGPTSEHVTVLRPSATAGHIAKAGVVLVVVVVLGNLLELLAYLFAPVTRIPAVRRWLEKDDVPPDGIEVRADRVTAVGRQAGRTIDRVDRAVLSAREVDGSPVLYVTGTYDDAATIDLDGYDLDDVGDAVLAHGWPWQPPGGGVTYPEAPVVEDDSTPAFEVVLRDGWERPLPGKVISASAVVLAVGAVVVYLVGFFLGVRDVPFLFVVIGLAVLFALAVVVLAIVWQQRSRLTFAVDSNRLVVRYGAAAKIVVPRSTVVSATALRRSVRIKQRGQPFRTYLPLAPRRRELLTAMTTYGWQVRDDVP